MRTPKESLPKDLPSENIAKKEIPKESEKKTEQPEITAKIETVPEELPKVETTPEESPKIETVPDPSPEKKEMPSDFNEENTVTIAGKKIEIKPTKLKYFRNKAASSYGIIKAIPLHELLTYGKGVFDNGRDADQLLYDFLVSVFDDSEFVRDNYDDMDADVIDKVCKIFGRINHIDEKEEEARKNKEAQAKR